MPTGYTARICEGEQVTFPQFAMECARAFGALIEMRDEAMDAPIPGEFTPSPFYAEHHKKAQARIAEVSAWDDAKAEAEANAEYEGAVRSMEETNAVGRERRSRYEAMLEQVRAWEPPTADHAGMKDFMIEQLERSIEFDCHEFTDFSEVPHRMTGAEYKAGQLEQARRDAERSQRHYAEEVERARGRTEWLRALRSSLAGQTASA